MAKSGAFHWVKVDRDRTPELPNRFAVQAYPSVLVLGDRDENVHRFDGFLEPGRFVPQLDDALARHALYRAGKPWDHPPARPDHLCDEGDCDAVEAPGDEVPGGLVPVGEHLWVAQGKELLRLDARRELVQKRLPAPPSTQDLATDGKRLFVLTAGWTAGEPILVLDGVTGERLGEIRTAANAGGKSSDARGLAWVDGRLWVLGIMGELREVDPANGEVLRRVDLGQRFVFGLAWDGTRFAAGSRDGLLLFGADGKVTRRIPTHYPLRAVASEGEGWLLMEQPVFGFDREHRRIRVQPQETRIHWLRPYPAGAVVLRMERVEGKVRYALGGAGIDAAELRQKLADLLGDRTRWVPGPDGAPAPPPCVVVPGGEVLYGEVAEAVEQVKKAGFTEVSFGGSMMPWRDRLRR